MAAEKNLGFDLPDQDIHKLQVQMANQPSYASTCVCATTAAITYSALLHSDAQTHTLTRCVVVVRLLLLHVCSIQAPYASDMSYANT
jgi:hypothetical protein